MGLREIHTDAWFSPNIRKWIWLIAAIYCTFVVLVLIIVTAGEGFFPGILYAIVAGLCWWRWSVLRKRERMFNPPASPPDQPVP